MAAENMPHRPGVWSALRSVIALMSPSRRRQFYATLVLMVVGAVAELTTIGAALPFLAVISDPQRATEIPMVAKIFGFLGWPPGDVLVLPATLLLIAAALVAAAVRLWLTWTTNAFVFSLGHDLSVAMFSRVLRQPYLYHVERNTSEVIAGVEKVQEALFAVLLPVMQALVSGFIGLFIVAMLVAIDPLMAGVAAITIAALYLGLSFSFRPVLQRNSQVLGEAHTLRIKQVQEGLGGIRDILLDRSQPVFEQAFNDVDDRLRRAQMVNTFLTGAPRMVIEAAAIVLIALLALQMSRQAGGLVMAIPILGGLAIGAQRLLPLIQTVYTAWSRTAGSLQILIDISGLLSAPVEAPADDEESARPFACEIVFDQVGMNFPGGRRAALSDVSLAIGKGERVGLVGETGSGKSTLLDLLMGLLEPTSGEIRVDGEPLDGRGRRRWQRQIAHVPQSIYLADTSIRENIAFGSAPDRIDDRRVCEAAKRAQIADFIDGLPERYETRIGERGVRLSGGQRQRIGIARALYKQAPVLILDEATSALDNETEAAVMDSLRKLEPDLTVLIVAHRLSTLEGCDRVIGLSHGRLAEAKASATENEPGATMPKAG